MTEATRRNVLLLAAAHWAAGVALILIDYYGRGMRIDAHTMAWTAYSCILWMAMLPLTLRVTRAWDDRITAGRIAALFLSVLAAAAVAEVCYFATVNIALRAVSQSPIDVFHATLTSITYPTMTILSATMIATVVRSASAAHERALAVLRDEQKLAEARLSVLQSQLQPHFLFNSLNSVAALIRNDRAEAARMLEHLRRFYTAASAAGARDCVPLAEELALAGEYLGIEQIRFSSRLEVFIDADDDVRLASVPALVLQPLAENAVRHGISRVPGPGFVRIEAKRAGDRLRITVENRIARDGIVRKGIGLANTRARLEQMYGDAAAFEMTSEDERFRVTIALPWREVA